MQLYVFLIVFFSAIFSASFGVTSKWLLDRGATPNSVFLCSSLFIFVSSLLICGILACSTHAKQNMQISTKGFSGFGLPALALASMGITIFTYLFLTVLNMEDVSSLVPLRNVAIIVLTVIGGILCLGEKTTLTRIVALVLMIMGISLLCFY